MNCWNNETGEWLKPDCIWNVDMNIPEGSPDIWLSKPGGEYYIGVSFHISPYTHIEGSGVTQSSIVYQESDFHLARYHDPYNPWGVNAKKNAFSRRGCMEFWDWLPGIMVYDKSAKYTLPDPKLSAYAGTEWADNDRRVFHGIFCDDTRNSMLSKYLKVINEITGPRFAGWPFGYRQLTDSAFVWVHSETHEIHSILLTSIVQAGDKYSYFNSNLYDPGTRLRAWQAEPNTWDCRRVLKFLYKSRLLLDDGFHEIALVTASSSLETSFFEIVLHLENGDVVKTKNLIKQHSYRDRAKILISSYGYQLPSSLFEKLTAAYKARNSIAHELNSFSHEEAAEHINNLESIIEWYYQNI